MERRKISWKKSRNLFLAYVEYGHYDGSKFSIYNMFLPWWFHRNWTNIWKASSNLFSMQFFFNGLLQKKFNTSAPSWSAKTYTRIPRIDKWEFLKYFLRCKKIRFFNVCSVCTLCKISFSSKNIQFSNFLKFCNFHAKIFFLPFKYILLFF